jgi:photosystem II stability/assembly factor-like uncharacterized protein
VAAGDPTGLGSTPLILRLLRQSKEVFVGVAAVLLLGASVVLAFAGRSSSAPLRRTALVPNAVTFLDRMHGVLGTGYRYCENHGCRVKGTVSLTADGGRTWRVVLRTPRPVVSVIRVGDARVVYVQYDDGTTLRSGDGGETWHRALALSPYGVSVCPQGMSVGVNTQAYGRQDWSLCTGEPGAGNQAKAVYRLRARGWVRVAYTPMGPRDHGYGGIATYGYPVGIGGSDDGFGVIWERRGTLYVSGDGGHHWSALPQVARPEIDFGEWAYALPRGGVGFVVLARGPACPCRLIETMNAGRSWRVVHRWRPTR